MKMTLSKALRYKKRVVENIRNLEQEVQQNNCKIEGEERDVDVRLCLKIRAVWVRHLVELKMALQTKTLPIMRSILEMAELKAEIASLQHLQTNHGTVRATYRDALNLKYEAEIRKPERDKMIKELQAKIDDYQTTIDAYNAETLVELADPELP